LVDTSAWCAIEDGHDAHHAAALQFTEEIAGACELVTTD
jgi:predicted nucleic acid-binding protein